jgi:hypothetical protein
MLLAHKPLEDSEIQKEIFQQFAGLTSERVNLESWQPDVYLDRFTAWMASSSYNKIIGLENFTHRAYAAGANDVIQEFVKRHAINRRLRFSQAEFAGAKINCNSMQANWCWLEDCPIEKNDAVILSWPFAGNGNTYPSQQDLLKTCEHLEVPVLIDLAYFGISYDMAFDVTSPCITDIAVSLSKPFFTPLRLGIRYCRNYHDDVIQVSNNIKTYNRMSVSVGIELMKKFSHDWLMKKYLPINQKVCDQLNLEPTPTITLAIGNALQHSDYFRNGYHRICITNELHETVL